MSQTVNRLFKAAFGPSATFYRQLSMCGWRGLVDHGWRASGADSKQLTGLVRNSDLFTDFNIYETHDAVIVEFELIDIDIDSLHLEVKGDLLMIRAERLQTNQGTYRMPDSNGRPHLFQRVIQLPESAGPGEVRARMVGDNIKIDIRKR